MFEATHTHKVCGLTYYSYAIKQDATDEGRISSVVGIRGQNTNKSMEL